MKLKTKILTLTFLLTAPFCCQAIPFPSINEKQIIWSATCGVVQAKAALKYESLKNKIDSDHEKATALYEKLKNISSELKSRGYPMQKVEEDIEKFSDRAYYATTYADQTVAILKDIKDHACQKDKVWALNRLTEARNKMQQGKSFYEELRYRSRVEFFDHLSDLRDHRVRSNR